MLLAILYSVSFAYDIGWLSSLEYLVGLANDPGTRYRTTYDGRACARSKLIIMMAKDKRQILTVWLVFVESFSFCSV